MKRPIAFLIAAASAMQCIPDAVLAQSDCGAPHGDYVVIEVKWEDSIGGLAVRDEPRNDGTRRGVIPAAGTGIGIGECLGSGWCQVKYACLSGWSLLARFL